MEISLNRINYFKKLPKHVKLDIIFNMMHESFDEGSHLYKMGDKSQKMYLIQSGCLEIVIDSDKTFTFVIERLYRGSIINQNSFLMDDEMDTNAFCKTNLHVFSITRQKVQELRQKYIELDKALDKQERHLLSDMKNEPAIDYIIQDDI